MGIWLRTLVYQQVEGRARLPSAGDLKVRFAAIRAPMRPHGLSSVAFIPTFIPTTGRTTPHRHRRLRNIVRIQGACANDRELPFGTYDLFAIR